MELRGLNASCNSRRLSLLVTSRERLQRISIYSIEFVLIFIHAIVFLNYKQWAQQYCVTILFVNFQTISNIKNMPRADIQFAKGSQPKHKEFSWSKNHRKESRMDLGQCSSQGTGPFSSIEASPAAIIIGQRDADFIKRGWTFPTKIDFRTAKHLNNLSACNVFSCQ